MKLSLKVFIIRIKEFFGIRLSNQDDFVLFRWHYRNIDWNKMIHEPNPFLNIVRKAVNKWEGATIIKPFGDQQ